MTSSRRFGKRSSDGDSCRGCCGGRGVGGAEVAVVMHEMLYMIFFSLDVIDASDGSVDRPTNQHATNVFNLLPRRSMHIVLY